MQYPSAPVIQTRSGPVSGTQENQLRVFRGIPYAAAPVGPLRWRPPQPVKPWTAVRPATRFGPDCPQNSAIVSRAEHQGEDCLYLNVWTPVGAEPGSLPVMVWIHGGSFVYGSGSEALFDPAHLVANDVIVVTLNYRLGIFGFLAHPELTAESPNQSSSNYALLDQLAALRWVQDNIEAFGGDPKRVTAFGVSAGSGSLSLLLTSPLFDQHFSKAIMHSPGAARRLASLEDAEKAGHAVAAKVNDLRQLSETDLLAKTPLLAPKIRGLTTPRVLRPIRDGWVIPQDELQAFQKGALPVVPAIIGTNGDEGSEATASWPVETVEQYRQLIDSSFPECPDEALAQYPATSDEQVKAQVGHLFGDTQFNYGARLLAKTLATNNGNVWRYVFTRRYPGQTDGGPHHGQEVPYAFGNLDTPLWNNQPVPPYNDTDRQLSHAMLNAWVAFAKNGDPNHPDMAQWPRFEANTDNYLDLGDSVQADSNWRRSQLDFMERYFGTI